MLAIPAAPFGCFFDENSAVGFDVSNLCLARYSPNPMIECLTNFIVETATELMCAELAW
jgi:hypothetical protein